MPPPARLTIVMYNLHSGVGADLKLDLDRIADLIRDQGADIVGLCEVDQGTRRSGQVDQTRHIAERLGCCYAYGPSFMYDGGAFGNAVLRRYPIVSSTNHPLPNIHFNEPRGLLEAQVDTGGDMLNAFVTHLDVEYADSRLAQARAVIEISSKAAGISGGRPEQQKATSRSHSRAATTAGTHEATAGGLLKRATAPTARLRREGEQSRGNKHSRRRESQHVETMASG